jgi:hypothetical protein
MRVCRRRYCSALRSGDTSVCLKKLEDDDGIDVGEYAYDRISSPGKRYKYVMIGKSPLGRRENSEARKVSPHLFLPPVSMPF